MACHKGLVHAAQLFGKPIRSKPLHHHSPFVSLEDRWAFCPGAHSETEEVSNEKNLGWLGL